MKQAAEALGISSEGIRQRIRRGSLESEKDTDGRVYVFIDEEAANGTPYEPSTDDVVSRLENEVEFLRKELATRDAEIQRRDAVLLSLSEGLKAVNPPPVSPEVRDSSVTTSEEPYSTHAPPHRRRRYRTRNTSVAGGERSLGWSKVVILVIYVLLGYAELLAFP